jgi:hypothetical protein
MVRCGWSPEPSDERLIRKELDMDLSTRAGINSLGKYRSSRKHVAQALAQLGQQVVVPCIDTGLYSRIQTFYTGLDVGRDNRSVTDDKWVEKGLAKYGCPIHGSKSDSTESWGVTGRGICACRKGERPTARTSSRSVAGVFGPRIEDQRRRGSEADIRLRPAGGTTRGTQPSNRRGSVSSDGSDNHDKSDGRRSKAAYQRAVDTTLSMVGGGERRSVPLSLSEVVAHHIDPTAYAGAPYFRRNELVMGAAAQAAAAIMVGERGFDPYVAGRRVQPGASVPKTRLVWMAPLASTIVGTGFSKPISQALARKRPFTWGLRDVEKGAILEELKSRYRYVYSLDYSGFDTSVPAMMIDDAFSIAKSHLNLSEAELSVWKRYVSDFIHSRLITPTGDVWQKHKGVPSGSAFTSIIGSIVNLLLLNYMHIRVFGHGIEQDRVLILGDDVVFATNNFVELGKLSAYAGELGFTVSVEKSSVTDTHAESPGPYKNQVHFLGHYWVHGMARRPVHEILQRMAFPERHRKRTDKESLIRLFSYLQDSREAWEIFRMIYRNPDILSALTDCLDDIGEESQTFTVNDLPGQLRYRAKVEGQHLPIPHRRRGVALGIIGPAL